MLGLLGPNGAGKTTTVRMMTTLSRPTSGTARVAGHDVLKEPDAVRRWMGLTGQTATVDELLTGRENLAAHRRALRPRPATARRVGDDLLERFSLTDAADRVVKTYSGGMRRRLDLAVSLVATPPVLFLDEPTTGLDPRSRVELWDVLRELVRDGTTLLLTTQYLEEADQLADQHRGHRQGPDHRPGHPAPAQGPVRAGRVVVTVSHAEDLRRAEELLRAVVPEVHVDQGARRLTAPAEGLGDMTRIAAAFDGSGIELDDLGLQRPSLDDVFLHLTGHRAEETRPRTRARRPSDDHRRRPSSARRSGRPACSASPWRSSGAT